MTRQRTVLIAALVQSAAMLASLSEGRAELVEFRAEASDGRKVVGGAAAFGEETLTLNTAEGPVELPVAELMTLSAVKPATPPPDEPAAWLTLVDGSTIVASQWTLEGAAAQVTLLDGQAIDVPRRAIVAIRFRPAADTIAEQWERLVQMKHDGDVVVVRKEDNLDFLRGIVRGATEESVEFEMGGDVLPVRRSRLYGIVLLRPAGRDLPAEVCRVTDHTGSEWSVQSLSMPKGFEWTTPTGVQVSRPLESIVHIDFSGGKIAYLADLDPQSVNWQPFFPMDKEMASRRDFFQPRRNRGLESDALELGGVQYERGLAMHSRSEIVYRLPDGMTKLKATAGIDDRVRPHGNVVLIIRGDGETLFEGTLDGTDPPLQLDLDITGVRRLTILCDFGEGMDIADHLNLCNLRVMK